MLYKGFSIVGYASDNRLLCFNKKSEIQYVYTEVTKNSHA